MTLDDLPAAVALEIDALCDDFERHWRRARRRGEPAPGVEAFVGQASAGRDALRRCLLDLERDLLLGVALPVLPGLTLEEEIGRGGMGVVYRARREDGRAVALKLIPGDEHARWSRWIAELRNLRHPNLVPLEAFGSHERLHYVVMPLVAGGDLRERRGEFIIAPGGNGDAVRRVAGLVARVADAVGYLHRHGIVHRDLKPSNILLTPGQDPEPLVCDFGLAARLDGDREPGRMAGTPPYAAPEQVEGRAVMAAADTWSLGAVLHELLTGRPPGGEVTLAEEGLGAVCRRCLCGDPGARYGAAELAVVLRSVVAQASRL